MTKRLISVLLSLMMLASMVTVGVSADEAEWTAYENTVLFTEETEGETSEDTSSEESSDENSDESTESSETSEDNTESSESSESSDESSESSEPSGESSEPYDPSGESSESSDPSGEESGSEIIETIGAPVVTASNVAKTGKVKLTWTAVEGAKEYKVYRSEDGVTDFTLMKTTANTSYTNTNSEFGKVYYYRVKAIAADGTGSEFSSIISARAVMGTTKATASNIEASGKIRLTWTAVEGAKQYIVFRAAKKDGTYTRMFTTTGTSYNNTSAEAGKKYFYKVRAVPADSTMKNTTSAVVSRTCDLKQPVVTAANIASTGKIQLSWKKITGAVKYRVYRADAKNGEYKLMKTVTETAYINKSAEPDTKYYYKVRAVAANTNANSAYSAVISRFCDLEQPTLQVVANDKGKPEAKWNEVPGAVKYQVYRSATKNGTYKRVFTTEGTNYINSGAKVGETFYYKVKAIASNTNANSVFSKVDDCLCVKNSYKYTMSSFTTVKWADENRDTNLRIACEYIDGTILAPGEEFSFEDIVGPRVESRGFVMGSSIPEPTIGGGICQVATTVFNAALYANLKITDREQHSIACTFIVPGRDAMIHSNWSDFCFVNDSEYAIKISAKADGGYVTIKFLTREKGVSPRDDVTLKVLKTGSHEYVLVRRYKGVPNYYTYTKYEY